jgi:RNA polymerase sigma-70 factor (ECF subfamily)
LTAVSPFAAALNGSSGFSAIDRMKPRGVPLPAPVSVPAISASLALVSAENDLVVRIRAGDEQAFEVMYLEYYPPLCAFVVSLVGARDLAEELVQDVLCRVWELRRQWHPAGGTLRGYLFAAARNRALNHIRRRRMEADVAQIAIRDALPLGAGQRTSIPDTDAERADFMRAFGQAIAELPPRCREACLLRWRHGLTYPETAAAMGVTVKAAEALLTRGLKSVRGALGAFALDGPP